MEPIVYKILQRRQLLRDILNIAKRENPVQLAVVREALMEMALLDYALDKVLRNKRAV